MKTKEHDMKRETTMGRHGSRRQWLRCAQILVLAWGGIGLGLGCGGSDDDGQEPNPITPSSTQVLRVGNAEGSAGGTAAIVLSLESTEPLTGLQFDLLLDPAILTVSDAVTTGRTAGFEVFRSSPAVGITRVVLTDMNGTAQLAQGDGAVVTLTVGIDAGAPLGTSEVSTADALATDASATPVSLGSGSATFTVR
jgi:hypothetical protein